MTTPSARATTATGEDRAPVGLPPAALLVGYTILCLLPLLLAVIQGHPLRSFTRELSGGLIMVAYVMTLAQFVMSGRFEALTGPTGIDRTMRFHQVATWFIMAAFSAHPLLYSVPDLVPNPMDAVASLHRRFFLAPSLRTGVIAWWVTILLVLMAVWRDRLPFRYEWWRLSHGVLAVVIALYGTHHTLRVGTYSADPPARGLLEGGHGRRRVHDGLHLFHQTAPAPAQALSVGIQPQGSGADVGAGA